MRAFAQATQADFEELDGILEDGQLHIYRNRELPTGCVPRVARLGFEKDRGTYTVYIDDNIETDIQDADFARWIEKGEARFTSMDGLAAFLHSFAPLFDRMEGQEVCDEAAVENRMGGISADRTETTKADEVVDRAKLKDIKEKKNEKKIVWPEEISGALKKEIFGQDAAIDALAEGIVINRMRHEDKIYVALFLGPPASGKTETGSILAKVLSDLYGQEYGFIKVNANTYRQEHMIQNILGAPPGYVGYGKKTVLEPVRRQPYHVILFDEIEKAHEDLLVALMEAMDTGFLSMADNSPQIDMNKCILLFTSNIPVDMEEYSAAAEEEKDEMCRDIFTRHCGRPEISRRIRDYMVYVPVSEDAKVDIIIKFAKKTVQDYGAELAHIDEHLMAGFLEHGTKYGASEIAGRVSKAFGRAMVRAHDNGMLCGKRVAVKGTPANIKFEVVRG